MARIQAPECAIRTAILDSMQAQVDDMQKAVQEFRDGNAGCGFAWMAPDKYRSLIDDLARHDGTNGNVSTCKCGGAREGL